MGKINVPKAEVTVHAGIGNGRVAVVYDDSGSLCGSESVHMVLIFTSFDQAKRYCEEELIPGKNAKIKVYPTRFK